MTTVTINKVKNLQDVKLLFQQLNQFFGLGWLPYDDFVDGIFNKAGETYDQKEGERLNRLIDEAFDVCDNEGIDIADIGLEVTEPMRKELGIGFEN